MKRVLVTAGVLFVLVAGAVAGLKRQNVGHRMYRPVEGGGSPVLMRDSTAEWSYSLAFVEFDDQGFFWDARQLEAATAHIREVARNRGVVIIAFAHGWNHNASAADNNVACFTEVLKAASMIQLANHRDAPSRARPVVGVYLGWRGLVFEPGWLNQALTFWNRVTVADRIGARGDLLRTLTTLRELRATLEPERTRLIIAGHSMGARALFAALGPFYKENAFRAGAGQPMQWDATQSFGDLVALVNPAFSAAEYRPIDEAARAAYGNADADMEPNLLIVSSLADEATRDYYPRAQKVSSLLQRFRAPEDRQVLATTIGHHRPFRTHYLSVESGDVPPAAWTGNRCPYVQAEELGVVRGQARVAQTEDLFTYDRIRHFAPHGGTQDEDVVFTTILESADPTGPRRGPFMVVAADGALIPGHNEIFTPGFLDFLVRVVNRKARPAR